MLIVSVTCSLFLILLLPHLCLVLSIFVTLAVLLSPLAIPMLHDQI